MDQLIEINSLEEYEKAIQTKSIILFTILSFMLLPPVFCLFILRDYCIILHNPVSIVLYRS